MLAAPAGPPLRRLRRLPDLARSERVRQTVKAAAGTAFGSAAGAVLPFVVTRQVAPAERTDVFFLLAGVAQLCAFLLATVAEGAFLPMAQKVQQREPQDLRAFARSSIPHVLLVTLPVVGGLLIVNRVLLSTSDFSPAQVHEGRVLLPVLLLLPVLVAVSSVFSAVHYAMNHFVLTTASQGFRAVGGLLGSLLAAAHGGIVLVALGMAAGEAVRLCVLALTLPARRPGRQPDVDGAAGRAMFLQSATPLLFATVIVAVNPLVDKAVASHLGVGGVTLIELAEKLFYVPMVLLFSAVTIVSGVTWGSMAEDRPEQLRADFWRVQRLAVVASTGIAVVAAVVVLVLDHRVLQFLRLDAGVPFGAVFLAYIVGLPFAMGQSLAGRLLVIKRQTRLLPYIAVGLVLLNLVADLLGAWLLGVRGLAVSSSLVRVANAAAFLYLARLYLRSLQPA